MSSKDAMNVDIWLIGGQSNAMGQRAIRREPIVPDPRVLIFGTDYEWHTAEEPLCPFWFPHGDAYGRVVVRNKHTELPEQMEGDHPDMASGPAIFFGQHLVQHVDRSIGFVAFGIGGSMKNRWDPELRDPDGYSMYDGLVEFVSKAGSSYKGFIWYQGESDAVTPEDTPDYEAILPRFVDRLRTDLGVPGLPVILVQIGRLARGPHRSGPAGADIEAGDRNWEMVREAQRKIASQRANIHLVSPLDLSLDDPIHLSGPAQQRLGARLGEVALGQVYGLPGHATSIELGSVDLLDSRPGREVIRVGFTGVNGRLVCAGRPTGFELRLPPEKGGGPTIYDAEIDPDDGTAVVLRATGPLGEGTSLMHGAGMDPYVNIHDEKDVPIPAFGPVVVPQ